jgi:uncharacterized radical SAM superfamily Fe-S cluster-containing enzyme
MDANAASYVHELDMRDVTAVFERAKSFKPQREINVLFSGGEATLSPIFLDAIQHANGFNEFFRCKRVPDKVALKIRKGHLAVVEHLQEKLE